MSQRMTTHSYRLLSSLLALMAVMKVSGQVAPQVPRLVVSIVVDQLRTDYLQAFMPLYGHGGFERFINQGRAYLHAEYPFAAPDRASAMACLMSGTTPYENGIVAQRWLSRETLQPVFCVDEKQYGTLHNAQSGSAARLCVSTLPDELKMATDGKALVYSIAPHRDAAILGAGHAADGSFWLSDSDSHWQTTPYYGAVPSWFGYYDSARQLKERLNTMMWKPVSELVGSYNYFSAGLQSKPFAHSFRGERGMQRYKASAMVNEEVTNFATHVLRNSMMGTDAIPDFLSLTYYAGTYDNRPVSLSGMELQDTYVRLDEQISQLVNDIEQRLGKGRVLFVLTGTGYGGEEQSEQDIQRYRIPTGEFNITRAQMLLNMYLSAVYGQGTYVEAAWGNQFYLNLKYIESKGINQSELLERSQAFLLQLSGVRDVFTSHRLLMGAGQAGIDRLRNAYNPRCSGDIMVAVSPGWYLVNEHSAQRILQRESFLSFPIIFLGTNIQPETINTPVMVDRVAPTLSAQLRIRAPNGCRAVPLY